MVLVHAYDCIQAQIEMQYDKGREGEELPSEPVFSSPSSDDSSDEEPESSDEEESESESEEEDLPVPELVTLSPAIITKQS